LAGPKFLGRFLGRSILGRFLGRSILGRFLGRSILGRFLGSTENNQSNYQARAIRNSLN
jgi:hypothetical protein